MSSTPTPDPALQDALAESRKKSSNGISTVTLALGGALILAVGFIGGYAIKGAASDSNPPNRFAAGQRLGGNAGPNGQGGRGGFAGNATIGTVSAVKGNIVTIKTMAGKTVKVTTSTGTKITVNTSGTVSDLADGDTVVVTGKAGDNGDVSADSIAEGGGFGGRPGAQRSAN